MGGTRFRFAVLADCHLEPEASDPAREPRSNRRARAVIDAINRAKPDLVVYMGDYTHAPPSMPAQAAARDAASRIFASLEAPVHATPGNVDIGDKPSPWMPAVEVSSAHLAGYVAAFGPSHQVVTHESCVFVFLAASLLNSGLEEEAVQRDWVEKTLARHAGGRIFLVTHYPPYLVDPKEPGHYDNIDEPGRSWLLDLVRRHRVEAVFGGHVHNFFYNRLGDTELYVVPSVAFARRDYAEMYAVAPTAAMEFGRNDTDKLGFFLVDVRDDGHVARWIRSRGAEAGPIDITPALHPKDDHRSPVGAYLRFPWANLVELPLQSPVDEFARRRVRNDYVLQAIWDLGLRRLRVPVADLLDDAHRRRMGDLVRLGHDFTVCLAGLPDAAGIDALCARAAEVGAWEVVLPRAQVAGALPDLARLASRSGRPVALAIRQKLGERREDETLGKYAIGHGFALSDEALAAEFLGLPGAAQAVQRLVFATGLAADPQAVLPAMQAIARRLGLPIDVTLFFAAEHPDVPSLDHAATAHRVALAALAAHGLDGITLFLDTFMDMDRSYYPRVGLVDRRCNLNPAGHALAAVTATLAGAGAGRLERLAAADGDERHLWRGAGRSVLLARGAGAVDLAETIGGSRVLRRIVRHDLSTRARRELDAAGPGMVAVGDGSLLLVLDHD
jgi:Icc-related predicted phosphoesterase